MLTRQERFKIWGKVAVEAVATLTLLAVIFVAADVAGDQVAKNRHSRTQQASWIAR